MKTHLNLAFLLILSVFFSCTGITQENRKDTNTELHKRPTKQHQRFRDDGEVYTVHSFFGSSGLEYATYEEAVINDKSGGIGIKNKEYKGISRWDSAILLASQDVDSEKFSPVHENYKTNLKGILRIWDALNRNQPELLKELMLPTTATKILPLEEIKKILNENPKPAWKLVTQRIEKERIQYNLFAKPIRYAQDPETSPFLELEIFINNLKSIDLAESIDVKFGEKINLEIFEQMGISPSLLPPEERAFLNPKSLSAVIANQETLELSARKKEFLSETKIFAASLERMEKLDTDELVQYLRSFAQKEASVFSLSLIVSLYHNSLESDILDDPAEIKYYVSDAFAEIVLNYAETESPLEIDASHFFIRTVDIERGIDISDAQKAQLRDLIANAKEDIALDMLGTLKLDGKLKNHVLFLQKAIRWVESLTPEVKNKNLPYRVYSSYRSAISAALIELT